MAKVGGSTENQKRIIYIRWNWIHHLLEVIRLVGLPGSANWLPIGEANPDHYRWVCGFYRIFWWTCIIYTIFMVSCVRALYLYLIILIYKNYFIDKKWCRNKSTAPKSTNRRLALQHAIKIIVSLMKFINIISSYFMHVTSLKFIFTSNRHLYD